MGKTLWANGIIINIFKNGSVTDPSLELCFRTANRLIEVTDQTDPDMLVFQLGNNSMVNFVFLYQLTVISEFVCYMRIEVWKK